MTAYAWDIAAATVKEIIPADEFRDELVVQLHTQVEAGASPVFLGFGEDATTETGIFLGGIGHTARVLGAKARLAVSALSAAVSSGGIETHTSIEYRHVPNYPIWQKPGGGQEAPTLIHTSPVDDYDEVSITWDPFMLMFDMNVQAGAGVITLFDALTDTPVESVDIGDTVIDGATVSFAFVAPMTLDTAYYIRIDSGVIESIGGVAWGGINDAATWSFTTVL